ncbi:MAG: hypothetical protein JWM86_574 [Thermoleophilia bacterium]|nr:hypothetical protein [Thermoleophilia bacterium]
MARRTEIIEDDPRIGDPRRDPEGNMGPVVIGLVVVVLLLLVLYLAFGRDDANDTPVDNVTNIEQNDDDGADEQQTQTETQTETETETQTETETEPAPEPDAGAATEPTG